MNLQYQVLLYYKYVSIKNPGKLRDAQIALCQKLNLRGRIIIAQEGINGTVEGLKKDTQKYIKEMSKIEYFKDISYKKSPGTGQAFPKLSIKVRPEIVASHLTQVNPTKVTGKYLIPSQLHSWFKDKKEFNFEQSEDQNPEGQRPKEFYILDIRNDYEYSSGYFEGSILSGMTNFYDLPKVLPRLKHLKDKTVVTVCTGGVRCEKASGYLLQNGFKDVYQLKDGIQTYMEKYPNQHFKGKLYVFDNRLTLGFNIDDKNHQIVGRCFNCLKPSDSYVNCALDFCHYHYICCDKCLDKETSLAFCKKECQKKYLIQTAHLK